MILHYFSEMGLMELECVEVECGDIRPQFDTHITSIEANGGWWDVWAICGDSSDLVAVFEEDEE